MTEEERESELFKIGQQVKKLLPAYHGYIQFNLMPTRKDALITKHQTIIENKTNPNK